MAIDVVRHHHPGHDLERMRLPHPQDDLAHIVDAINQHRSQLLIRGRAQESAPPKKREPSALGRQVLHLPFCSGESEVSP